MAYIEKSADNLQELVLFSYWVELGIELRLSELGKVNLYLLSHPTGPHYTVPYPSFLNKMGLFFLALLLLFDFETESYCVAQTVLKPPL